MSIAQELVNDLNKKKAKSEKTRQIWWNVKDLLTIFFDYNGVVYDEFWPQGRMVYNFQLKPTLP